ncbi:DUF6177 family protein [Streptomyces sp. NBC_01304]|uniref:DUF6177 family protein n=1 Tax=Streptomyces sp. NBC_01304 TaxID=2903818 RepID=UPI002E0EAA22|nr:DUF6177 family protein [Streptomyces sp. NBC_01304]
MTKDIVALTEKMPDPKAILMGLYAGGPDLDAEALHDGAVIQLSTPAGRPLLAVDAPVLIHVPGETARLLGGDTALPDAPVWWTEVRASTAIPEAARLAASFAGRLNALRGGTTWPLGTATVEAVELTLETATAAAAALDEAQLSVDVLTEQAAVIIDDRPLIAATTHLTDVLRRAADAELALQIVTSPEARLTLPTRVALGGYPNRWVVRDEACGYYDGLSGAVLRWQQGQFSPLRTPEGEAQVAEAFKGSGALATGERQLLLSLRTCHAAVDDLTLGSSLEACWMGLTGTSPAGWGTAEPINLPWSTRKLTELARGRAPEPSWLAVVGHPDRPALATLTVRRTSAGVEEEITLALGYGPDEELPLDALEPLAATLAAEHGLITLLTNLRKARRDLTTPPHLEAPPLPLAFTIGADQVEEVGLDRAMRPPVSLTPTQLGSERYPALHYPLGDGSDAEAWSRLQILTEHLKAS